MKVVILCGGMGTRLREETEYKPKPMVEIGGKPILWHIMKHYAVHGFTDFVVCLGYKGNVIKDYFYNYALRTCDLTVSLGSANAVEFHNYAPENGWRITLAETGDSTMTGSRIKRVAKYLDGEPFMLTYGDGLSNVDVGALLKFHKKEGRIGTVTGVFPPSRFGEIVTKATRVASFAEKPQIDEVSINGGFFVFEPEFLDYLDDRGHCVLEREPLQKLTSEGELSIYQHKGFWQCMDTYRDFQLLNDLWTAKKAPWKTWKDDKNHHA